MLTTSNPRKQTKEIFIEHKKPFSFSPSHAPRKCERQKFFLTKTNRKIFIMATNNNGSNVIPTMDRRGGSSRDMVDTCNPQQTFLSIDLNSEKTIQWESRKVHPLIKRLFLSKSIPDVPLRGRLKHFVGAWMKITQDPKILNIVKGYKIPFHSKPFQSKIPPQPIVSRKGVELVKLKAKEMLKKGAIRKV